MQCLAKLRHNLTHLHFAPVLYVEAVYFGGEFIQYRM